MRTLFAVVFLIFFNKTSFSGNPSIALRNIPICTETELLMPVWGSGLSNVGALTLYFNFDPSQLDFLGLENINSGIKSLIYNELSNPSRVSVVWTRTTGVSFTNDLMFNLHFAVIKNSGTITFAIDSCEVANANIPPEILTIEYTNGAYYPGLPQISENPVSQTVFSQANVNFQVVAEETTEYRWQSSTDNGQSWKNLSDHSSCLGTQTSKLTLLRVPASFNGNIYRCELKKDLCSVLSDQAYLHVDSLSDVPKKSLNDIALDVYPNPISDIVTVSHFANKPGLYFAEIISMEGKTVVSQSCLINQPGEFTFSLNCVSLQIGLYVLKFRFVTESGYCFVTKKLIRSTK